MIKDVEIGKRYYNLKISTGHWHGVNSSLKTVGEKISVKNRGQKKPPRTAEHLLNLSLSQKGKPRPLHSDETKRKMSESHLGKKMPTRTDEHKRKLGLVKRGKPGTPWTEEQRVSVIEKLTGRPRSPETIARIKETLRLKRESGWRGRWANQDSSTST